MRRRVRWAARVRGTPGGDQAKGDDHNQAPHQFSLSACAISGTIAAIFTARYRKLAADVADNGKASPMPRVMISSAAQRGQAPCAAGWLGGVRARTTLAACHMSEELSGISLRPEW